jgi:hypothetical protein
MSNPVENIQQTFTEEKLNGIIEESWKTFLAQERERNLDKDNAEFFKALETSDFFTSMYNFAYRTGIVTGVKLLEEALKK